MFGEPMNEAAHTWRDLLIQRSTRTFTGRDDILEHFRLNCLDTVPRDLILLLQGIPGAGKSTTLARLREVALGYGIFSTCIDSSLATPVREKAILHAMCGIAEQFSARGTPLTQFEERYHEYIAALQRITADPHAPGRIFDAIGGFHDRDAWYSQVVGQLPQREIPGEYLAVDQAARRTTHRALCARPEYMGIGEAHPAVL